MAIKITSLFLALAVVSSSLEGGGCIDPAGRGRLILSPGSRGPGFNQVNPGPGSPGFGRNGGNFGGGYPGQSHPVGFRNSSGSSLAYIPRNLPQGGHQGNVGPKRDPGDQRFGVHPSFGPQNGFNNQKRNDGHRFNSLYNIGVTQDPRAVYGTHGTNAGPLNNGQWPLRRPIIPTGNNLNRWGPVGLPKQGGKVGPLSFLQQLINGGQKGSYGRRPEDKDDLPVRVTLSDVYNTDEGLVYAELTVYVLPTEETGPVQSQRYQNAAENVLNKLFKNN